MCIKKKESRAKIKEIHKLIAKYASLCIYQKALYMFVMGTSKVNMTQILI